jgi:hypothetical protein
VTECAEENQNREAGRKLCILKFVRSLRAWKLDDLSMAFKYLKIKISLFDYVSEVQNF